MIYSLGAVSGAHFNPAVTVAFAVRTVFPWRWVPAYLAAELAGAIAAAATLQVIFDPSGHQGTTYPHGTARQSLAMEILLTTLLVTVALSVAARHRLLGPDRADRRGRDDRRRRHGRHHGLGRLDEPGPLTRAGDRRRGSALTNGSTPSAR